MDNSKWEEIEKSDGLSCISLFSGPFSKEVAVPMTLKNISTSESVCWKVTTTAPFQYLCRPNKGIIHPQETVSPLGNLKPFELQGH